MEDQDFALRRRMLPSLAFVPEHDVIDCFMILMADFPQSAMEVAEYFEETYIGRRLPDQTRRLPPFPVRFWSIYTRVLNQTARTNNSVEGWHNAFQSGLSSPHPSFPKLMKHFQREQAIQDVNVDKWESGNIHLQSKSIKERNERLLNLVLDYDNRETLVYLKGIAQNFTFYTITINITSFRSLFQFV